MLRRHAVATLLLLLIGVGTAALVHAASHDDVAGACAICHVARRYPAASVSILAVVVHLQVERLAVAAAVPCAPPFRPRASGRAPPG